MSENNRIFGLDLLRAFAVCTVVYGHGDHFLKDYIHPWHYNLITFDGVSIFFVLSGFLIGRILIKTLLHDGFDGSMLREFWIRRWFRTLPNYFLILIFLIISYYLLGKQLPQIDILIRYFLFSQNLTSPHPSFFGEAWSLAVEEWFYLTIPLPFFIAAKFNIFNRRKLILFVIFTVIFFTTAIRIYKGYEMGYASEQLWDLHLRKQVLMRFDSLMFGVLGAYISLFRNEFWKQISPKAFYIGICLFLADKVIRRLPSINEFYINYLTLSVCGVATLLLLPKLSNWKQQSNYFTEAITFISLISYSMYLVNLAVVQVVIFGVYEHVCQNCAKKGMIIYMLYWLVTIGLSYLIYKYYEKPLTSMRDRWHSNKHSVAVAYAESSK